MEIWIKHNQLLEAHANEIESVISYASFWFNSRPLGEHHIVQRNNMSVRSGEVTVIQAILIEAHANEAKHFYKI